MKNSSQYKLNSTSYAKNGNFKSTDSLPKLTHSKTHQISKGSFNIGNQQQYQYKSVFDVYNNHRKNDFIRQKTLYNMKMVDKVESFGNEDHETNKEDAKLFSDLQPLSKRNALQNHIILQNDRYTTIELYKETKYAKINVENICWPMKLKTVAKEGTYRVCMSFMDNEPDLSTTIVEFPIRKEQLFKFYRPKHYRPQHAYFSLYSTSMAKVEIKVWFTDPQIEKWRHFTRHDRLQVSSLKTDNQKRKKIKTQNSDNEDNDSEYERKKIAMDSALYQLYEEQRQEDENLNKTNYIHHNMSNMKDNTTIYIQRSYQHKVQTMRQVQNYEKAKINEIKLFQERIHQQIVKQFNYIQNNKKRQRLKQLKQIHFLTRQWATISVFCDLIKGIRTRYIKRKMYLRLQDKKTQNINLIKISIGNYLKDFFPGANCFQRISIESKTPIVLTARLLKKQQKKRRDKAIVYAVKKLQPLNTVNELIIKSYKVKEMILRLWEKRKMLLALQIQVANMMYQKIKQQIIEEDSNQKQIEALGGETPENRNYLSTYFNNISKKVEKQIVTEFVANYKEKLRFESRMSGEKSKYQNSSHQSTVNEIPHLQNSKEKPKKKPGKPVKKKKKNERQGAARPSYIEIKEEIPTKEQQHDEEKEDHSQKSPELAEKDNQLEIQEKEKEKERERTKQILLKIASQKFSLISVKQDLRLLIEEKLEEMKSNEQEQKRRQSKLLQA